jgi:hypothetical protein
MRKKLSLQLRAERGLCVPQEGVRENMWKEGRIEAAEWKCNITHKYLESTGLWPYYSNAIWDLQYEKKKLSF